MERTLTTDAVKTQFIYISIIEKGYYFLENWRGFELGSGNRRFLVTTFASASFGDARQPFQVFTEASCVKLSG